MALLEALAEGTHGVIFVPPKTFEVSSDKSQQATLLDPEQRVVFHAFYFPRIHLDLSDDESLRRDVECHAQFLFEQMRRADESPGPSPPRSPLISCTQVTVDGNPALSILHRMVAKPGREIVMGHLLVPLKRGLFEVRWLTRAEQTGFRESVLLDKAMGAAKGVKVEALMKSIDYDDPKHDNEFPDHVLTRARGTERWIREDAGIRVVEPERRDRPREITLETLGCSIMPPPRFVCDGSTGRLATFHRVSLAGNDGLQVLFFQRQRNARNLEPNLETMAREVLARAGMILVSVASRPKVEPLAASIVADGESSNELRRVVGAGFIDADQCANLVCLLTTQSQPADALELELCAMAKSHQATARPWWKVW